MLQWEKAERSSIYSLVTSQLFNRNWGAFRCTMANGRWEFLNCVILKTKWGFLDCWGLGALFFVCRLYWCLEVERQRFLVISTGLSIIRTMWWGHNTRYVLSTTIRCAIGTKQSQTTRAHQRFFDWTIHKNHHRPRKTNHAETMSGSIPHKMNTCYTHFENLRRYKSPGSPGHTSSRLCADTSKGLIKVGHLDLIASLTELSRHAQLANVFTGIGDYKEH